MSQWPRSRVRRVRVVVTGLYTCATGSRWASASSQYVRWVLKASLEGVGCGGRITSFCQVSEAGRGAAGGFISALCDKEEGVTAERRAASTTGFLGGGREGTSGRGPFVLGGKVKGAMTEVFIFTDWSSEGGKEASCNRGRFAGGEACRVGEGELGSSGRLSKGELGIFGGPRGGEGGVGCESGISLGGVCQLSD